MSIYKKIFSVIVGLLLTFTIFAVYPQTEVFAGEDNYSLSETEELKYQDLFYYKLVEGKLHITRAVEDDHYDADGNLLYSDRCHITSLTIPDTLTIGGVSYPVEYIDGKVGSANGAFTDCFNLTSLKLPSTLKYIGDNAFSSCTSLPSVQIPDGVETLGCGAFGWCTSLNKVNIPKDCHSGDFAGEVAYAGPFAGDENLTDVTIAAGSTFIDNAMFDNSGLVSITIPDSVQKIGAHAFRNTENLTTVNISKNSKLASIGWTAFSGSGITSIYLPDTVEYVDVAAFAGCRQLKTVRISENMRCNDSQTERGYDTGIFNDCISLDNIIFPEGIKTIGRCWFFDSPIEKITIPASVTKIDDSAFRYCLNLNEVSFENGGALESIGERAFRGDKNLTEFSFPKTLKTIYGYAFETSGLRSAVLPDSLEVLYYGAFNECPELSSVTIPAKMTYDWGDNNGAFEKSNSLKTVVFKEGVTKIDAGLFGWNEGLESIEIPEGVTSIGRRSFRRCYNLKKIVLPSSLKEIGGEAFSDCTNLNDMVFSGTRPNVENSICENVAATVRFDTWDAIPDNWGGDLRFEGKTEGYFLTFDANGGKTDTPNKVIKKGEKYGTLPQASRKGYSFSGWYTEKEGGSKVSQETILEKNESVTVFAHWKPHKYSVKFKKNGGSGSMSKMKDLEYGKTYTLKKNKFERKGYIFRGWSTSKKGAIKYTNKAHIRNLTSKSKGTVTLYAVWEKKAVHTRYTIYYDANGGAGKMKPTHCWTESTYTLRKNAFKLTGYKFIGWSTKKNGTVKYGDKAAVRNLTTKAKGKRVLYAVWVKKTKKSEIKEAQSKIPELYGCVIGGCNTTIDNNPQYTEDEARDIYNKLKKNKIGGYKTVGKNIKLRLIENEEAPTREAIDTWITSAFKATTKDDISFVYYAGHGYGGGENGKGQGIALRTEDGGSECYSYNDFLELLNTSIKGKVILIVDACYSEGFATAAEKSGIKKRIAVLASSAIDENSQSDSDFSRSGSIFEQSARLWNSVTKKGKGYHLFTFALMKGLNWDKSGNYPADIYKDKAVTCEELFVYINSNISASGRDQTPKCYLGKLKDQIIFSY